MPMPRRARKGAVQPPLPGLCHTDKIVRPPKISESALQAQTRQTLANLGYGSAEVGATRKQVTCPCCAYRFFPSGWQGNTVGYPDLSIFRYVSDFPPIGVLLELKTDTGIPSKEQAAFAAAGRSQITYSLRETIEAVVHAEDAISAYRTPVAQRVRLIDFLKQNEGKLS